jgi:hypothetical protein
LIPQPFLATSQQDGVSSDLLQVVIE